MSVSAEDIAFARELFAQIPDLATRRMMGGLCLYSEGTIFAILSSEGQFYIKAPGALAAVLADEGSVQFTMTREDGTKAMNSYWTLPGAALDDPDLALDWARRALAELQTSRQKAAVKRT